MAFLAAVSPPEWVDWLNNFVPDSDLIATTTIEATEAIRSKITFICIRNATLKVRTIASILIVLVLVLQESPKFVLDEAQMNYFGEIIMAVIL